jgi:hypothetical protein
MKKLVALSLMAALASAALPAPVIGEPVEKTELVALDGRRVDDMPLRYDFDAVWVVDTQHVLYRDDHRAYYLVTLKAACPPLGIRSLGFNFHPGWSRQLRASDSYEIRPEAGSRCDVARIEKVDDARADPLREAAQRRAW